MSAGRQLSWDVAIKIVDAQVEVDDFAQANKLIWNSSTKRIS
jgi:hypothetical protein